MSYSVRIVVCLAAAVFAVSGPVVINSLLSAGAGRGVEADSGKPDGQARKEADEERAIAALTTLGVPLGRDPSGRVRWIEAAHGELSDEAMSDLIHLPMLEWLEIGGGKLTGAGMSHLKGCAALRRLYIHDIKLGNEALTWLSDLRLEALSLQRTGIAGKGLQPLKATDTLTVLNLSENEITDEDMSQVARFKSLEVLALQSTSVTGTGLAKLKDMARLNVLNLINCRIEDADLSHFTSMPNLRIVHASGCNLGDKAVKDISEKLKMLAIFR